MSATTIHRGDPCGEFLAAVRETLGNAPESIEPDRFHRFATSNRRGDSAGWCKLFLDLRGGIYGCYRQGISETWSGATKSAMTSAERAELVRQVKAAERERHVQQQRQWHQNARSIERLGAQSVRVTRGDPVSLYLNRRGLGNLWPVPEVLRLHPELPYWHDGKCLGGFPVMLAPMVSPDRRIVAWHRTFLTSDGCKAAVPEPKKLTRAAGPLAGASIPLFKPARGCIGVAEGIETALAASCASGVPVVAAYCSANVAAFQWPAGVRRLTIFADNDAAGRIASEALQVRAVRAGLQVSVVAPTDPGSDWADVWAARGVAECAA